MDNIADYAECCGDINCKCHADVEKESNILEELLAEQFTDNQ